MGSAVVSVVLKMTYGYTPSPNGDDPFIELADRALGEFSQAGMPGAWMVDVVPFCES